MPVRARRPSLAKKCAKKHHHLPHPSWAFLLLAISVIIANIFIAITRNGQNSSDIFPLELFGQTITLTGTIIKDPAESSSGDGKYNLTLSHVALAADTLPDGIQIFAQTADKDLKRTDIITIEGELQNGFGNYAAAIYRSTIKEIKRQDPPDPFLAFRDFFAEHIRNYLPEPQSGLAIGYLLGQKSGVSQNLQDALRTVGLTHIIVASGTHLGILTGLAKKLGKHLSRFAALLLSALLTIGFISITGLSASMLRAGLVTFLTLLAWYFGRDVRPVRLIVIVAAATLIYNPNYLTDPAWLLSFAAFTGILVVAPALARFFYGKDKRPGLLASTLLTSAASTLTCSPLLLFFFGQISLISIIANLLILPTVSIIMGLTLLTGLAAATNLTPLATIISKLDLLLLDYQMSVANFFASTKVFLIATDPYNPLVFLLYAPLIVVPFIALIVRRQKSKSPAYACTPP